MADMNPDVGVEDFIIALEKRYTNSQRDRAGRRELGYLRAYPHIIGYFKAIDKFDQASLTTATLMVYGWMPTIPVLNYEVIDAAISAINAAKRVDAPRVDKTEIEVLMAFVNRSLVGTSKLLHFVDPYKYAIYDSRVLSSITHEIKPPKGFTKIDCYLLYLDRLEALKTKLSEEHLTRIEKILGYKPSILRVLEMNYFFGE